MSQLENQSLWRDAWARLKKDRVAFISLIVVAIYAFLALAVVLGFFAGNWQEVVATSNLAPNSNNILGTDYLGRDVFSKVLVGIQVAMTVGLFSTLIATPIGIFLGAISGYFGGLIDDFIVWFYTVFESIPYIMLIMSIAFILEPGLSTVCIVLGVTGWVRLCRLIRGEVMKHKNREYVAAADAIGASHMRKLFIHILPNVFHIVIINASLQFVTAIKSEVILSYLGIGVQNMPSWGIMINDARQDLSNGVWWQLAAATGAMFFVVLSFNLLGDGLRDALDPKLKGKD